MRWKEKIRGAHVTLTLPPVHCFGDRNEELVRIVGPELFEEGLEVKAGLSFQNMTEHGPQLIRVTKVEGSEITIDSNHPYSGLTLTWDVMVLSLRHASAEEMEQGVATGMYTDKGCGGRKSCEELSDGTSADKLSNDKIALDYKYNYSI